MIAGPDDREFLYTLALALGRPNPDAMLSEMLPLHIREWKIFYTRHPFGEIRNDTRHALNSIALASSLGGSIENVESLFPYPRDETTDEPDESNILTGADLSARYQWRGPQ